MKKMFLVIMAGALAIVFSAFTGIKGDDEFLYRDDQMQWQEVPANINVPALCPEDDVQQCEISINGKLRKIYYSDHSPYLRN